MKTMNIYAKKGDRIKFSFPDNGSEFDKKEAKKYLKLNNIYTVEKTDIGNWHTEIYIKEIPNIFFNSVMFSDIKIS